MLASKTAEKDRATVLPLNNGLTAVLVPNDGLGTAGFTAVVRYGHAHSLMEDNNCDAHMLEHMLLEGTERRKSAKRIKSSLEEISVDWDLETCPDSTYFSVHVPKPYLKLSIDLISDVIFNSTIKRKGFEINRRQLVHENLARLEEFPNYEFTLNFDKELFRGHPISKDRIFKEEEINRLSLRKIFKTYKEQYVPKNVVIALCGAFEEQKAVRIIEACFGQFYCEGKRLELPALQTNQRGSKIIIKDGKAIQNQVYIGFREPSARTSTPKEIATSDVIANIINNRLYHNIRESEGETYEIGVDHKIEESYGKTVLYASTQPNYHERIRKLLIKEINEISSGEFGKREIAKMLKRFSIKAPLIKEDSGFFALQLSKFHAFSKDPLFLLKMHDSIKEITEEDVIKRASQFINIDKAVIAELKRN